MRIINGSANHSVNYPTGSVSEAKLASSRCGSTRQCERRRRFRRQVTETRPSSMRVWMAWANSKLTLLKFGVFRFQKRKSSAAMQVEMRYEARELRQHTVCSMRTGRIVISWLSPASSRTATACVDQLYESGSHATSACVCMCIYSASKDSHLLKGLCQRISESHEATPRSCATAAASP